MSDQNQPAAHSDGRHQAGRVTWEYVAAPMQPTLGSLFSGAGLLDLAVADALGARTLWVAETDDAASLVLAARFPGVPNHKDVRQLAAEPVDILAGGYPCQGESNAGKRLGDADPRWMWPAYRDVIAAMRPRLAIGENVRSHLGRSFRHVVADILGLGYAVVWGVVAASDVGACHRRERLWWLAWPTAVDGVTRTDALRICGNGVVRQQAAAAVAWLARRLPAALRAEPNLTDAATGAAPARQEATA